MSLLIDTWDFLATADNWTGPRGILARGQSHLWISLVASAMSAAIALPSAIWLAHRRIAPIASVAVVNIARAIPSFALIALVFPISLQFGFGLGFWPTCVALVALGIPPIFANTYAGVAGTPDDIIEAARGIGLREREVLRLVELPSAVPLIMNGIRVSVVQIVATATLGAIVGYECLGSFIVSGLARGRSGQPSVLVGGVFVAGLALSIDALLGALATRFAPRTEGAEGARAPSMSPHSSRIGA
jgi:osmoprotectant transport system permease protein